MCPVMGEYTKPEADVDIAAHAALTTGVHGVGTGTVGSKPIDRLAGKLATQGGWDTVPSPTNLANCTDGDWDTFSGTFVNTALAQYGVGNGYLQWDMGGLYTVELRLKIAYSSSIAYATIIPIFRIGATVGEEIECGSYHLGSAYGDAGILTKLFANISISHGRYLRLRIINESAQGDISLVVYEIQAIDLGV